MIPASLVFVPFIIGCGAEPITVDTPVNPVVSVRSDIDARAYRTSDDDFHSSTAIGMTVDSLEVTGASFVATDLKLHGSDQIGTLRGGQFLLVFEPNVNTYISDVEVLAGTYTRAEFEVHPLR